MSEQHKIIDGAIDTQHTEWYEANIDNYKTLAESVVAVLKTALKSKSISYVDIPFRHKDKKSFLKKLKGKSYKSYTDMTDLAGIRVITLVERDVEEVGSLINQLFSVHAEDSVNKSASLGENKVGYRSVHHVCDIGSQRSSLLENFPLEGLSFEIQVRTALEHAWAEIEHDRGYKLDGELPSHLKRRFALLSGLLESADLEFNRLTLEIEDYAKDVAQKLKSDNLDFELTTVGLEEFFNARYPEFKFKGGDWSSEYLFEKLKEFGIHNIKLLNEIIQSEYNFITENKLWINNTISSFLHDIMRISNLEKYLNRNDINVTLAFYQSDYHLLIKKYGEEEVDRLFGSYNTEIFPDGYFEV